MPLGIFLSGAMMTGCRLVTIRQARISQSPGYRAFGLLSYTPASTSEKYFYAGPAEGSTGNAAAAALPAGPQEGDCLVYVSLVSCNISVVSAQSHSL
jgi:hypothetical protein